MATSYALALVASPVTGSLPGLYLSLGLGALAGILVGMGVEARLGRTLRILAASLGLGVVGTMLAHFAGRLLYWGVGDRAGSMETLGGIPDEARLGVYALTIVGALLGVIAGSVLGASEGFRSRTARSEPPSSGRKEEGTRETAKASKAPEKSGKELPRSKAPGVDDVPMGQHPADSMSVEELLGDQE